MTCPVPGPFRHDLNFPDPKRDTGACFTQRRPRNFEQNEAVSLAPPLLETVPCESLHLY